MVSKNIYAKSILLILLPFVCLFLLFSHNSDNIDVITRLPGKASLFSNSSPKITILIVLTDGTQISQYKQALDSVKCYGKAQGYQVEVVDDREYSNECNYGDKFFRRHCIAIKFLQKTDYLLFLDADIGVVNPKRRIEEFLDPEFDIIFYDRFYNQEIMAGTYLVKNTEWGIQFLKGFADYETKLPPRFKRASDNGALHAYVFEVAYPDHKAQLELCMKVYNKTYDWESLFIFVSCFRSLFGVSEKHGKIKLMRKGTGWARDSWVSNSKWSPETDFMVHEWKSKNMRKYSDKDLPIGVTTRFRNTLWYNPILGSHDLEKCIPGNTTWNHDPNLIDSAQNITMKMDEWFAWINEGHYKKLAEITKVIESMKTT